MLALMFSVEKWSDKVLDKQCFKVMIHWNNIIVLRKDVLSCKSMGVISRFWNKEVSK